MNFNPNEPFRNKEIVKALSEEIHKEVDKSRIYNIMEVCGTHTMAIARSGIRSLLPENVKLISGPGCPVCVTAQGEIDLFFDLADRGVAICTFGDLLRIPGSDGRSLSSARAAGADVRVVYSPLDTISLASKESDKNFVFLGVGFETTAPAVAYLAKWAREKGLKNVSVLSLCKTMPEVIDTLLRDPELVLDGFLCPGHVTAVTGLSLYKNIISSNKAAVVAGFEASEILDAVLEIIRQVNAGKFHTVNKYKRVVNDSGNRAALMILSEVFKPVDASWRGLGILPLSGLSFKDEFAQWDAKAVYSLESRPVSEIRGCRCGSVLKGKITPDKCPLFGHLCTAESPIGPCMVSSEGACAAYYKYNI